jgi:Tfp pilus assembly protein PilV
MTVVGGDRGFVLVEVLIALVILAGIVVSAASLIAMFSALLQRSSTTDQIEEKLFELMAMGDHLSEEFPNSADFTSKSATTFLLSSKRDDGSVATATIELTSPAAGSAKLRIADVDGQQSIYDLMRFSDAKFVSQRSDGNYWSVENGLPPAGVAIIAARLDLLLQSRQFPIVLWRPTPELPK